MKCPACGVKHKSKRGAVNCYTYYSPSASVAWCIIAGSTPDKKDVEKKKKMEDYYNSLPY